ncbi:glycosyltransferase family 4 protein [Microbacterium sp. P5_E9]
MHIVQIVPFLQPGTGVGAVAWNLDRELRALGATVEAFTFDTARAGRPFHYPTTGIKGRLARMRRIVWFRFAGTRRARQYLAAHPDAISICHSEAIAGDIFVDHGSMIQAMRAAGHPLWRILLNPIQPLSYLHERARFRGGVHRTVVTLTAHGEADLVRLYGRVRPPVVTIPNGVDTDRFKPAAEDERARLRGEYSLDAEDRVALFIGHDLPGKGIQHAIAALVHAPTVLLLVVGGVASTVASARSLAESLGVSERVLFVGPRQDVERFLAMSDMFVFPSGYDAFGLVVLEALASGLPVVATRVGCTPDVVIDGVNGYLVMQDAAEIGDRLESVAAGDRAEWGRRARASVEDRTWRHVAQQYLELTERVAASRAAESAAA